MKETDAVKALAALAQETRLSIFRLLVRRGPEGLSAGDIARTLELPGATLSFHLSQLSNAGLIESQRESRSIRYSMRTDGIRKLLDFLVQDCCAGQPELCQVPILESSCCPPASKDAT